MKPRFKNKLHAFQNDMRKKNLHLVSPLEYSAMLKLYNTTAAAEGSAPKMSSKFKDITPDSGVVMENNTDSNKSKKDNDEGSH